MQWTGHPYLLCEEITDAVRQVLPLARNKGLSLFFDYTGAHPIAREDGRSVRALVERLLAAAVAGTRSGCVVCRVDVEASAPAECLLRLEVADTSSTPTELPQAESPPGAALPTQAGASLHAVQRLSSAMGGRFGYRHSEQDGGLAQVSVTVPCLAPIDTRELPKAPGPVAWLIGQRVLNLENLERRLQRLGWKPRIWTDPVQAEAELASGASAPPLLLVGSEWDGVTLGDMVWLRQLLPGQPNEPPLLFLGVDAASETARTAVAQGVYVQVLPFSPRQLAHVTELARVAMLKPAPAPAPASVVASGGAHAA